jgi:hypothetical protein
MNEKATKQIVSEIFGENGLIEADTTVDFTKLVTNIESKYEASVGAYLTDNIIPTIRCLCKETRTVKTGEQY